jgi:hypothetical protein
MADDVYESAGFRFVLSVSRTLSQAGRKRAHMVRSLCEARTQLQPEVLPQFSHLKHAPFGTISMPHSEHAGAPS